MDIIGRLEEKKELKKLMDTNRSEFLVIYGRRRVGKTYLIKNFFDHQFSFYSTGITSNKLESQLSNFNAALKLNPLYDEASDAATWMDAFKNLIKVLEKSEDKVKIIFIDELPWMDVSKSELISAVDYFWNTWASTRNDIKFIVCGSSASWMIKNVLKNKKGLYNRSTYRIRLKPFDLAETKLFLEKNKVKYNHSQILQIYMALGGIPYYLNMVDGNLSPAQNIDKLFFGLKAPLRDEYELIFASLFNKYRQHMKIVDALVKKKKGMNKAEIVKITGISDGGSLTTILNELEASEFIRIFNMPGKTLRNKLYQLTDQFILFYNNFIMKKSGQDENSWINTLNTPSYNAWAGLSFEMVWLQHTTQLKKLLGISGIQTNTYAWSNDKAQIDLIFDRADKIIHLFEIKFSDKPYTITKKYEQDLMKKLNEFQNHNKTTKAIWLSLLTSHGLESMENAGMIHSVVGIDGLF